MKQYVSFGLVLTETEHKPKLRKNDGNLASGKQKLGGDTLAQGRIKEKDDSKSDYLNWCKEG